MTTPMTRTRWASELRPAACARPCSSAPCARHSGTGRGQRDDDDHQDHRLRRRAAEIAAEPAVVVDLVDEGLGRLAGPAAGHGVDDAERVEERVDDVDDEQEERGRREQREDDRPEAARSGRAPSIAAASINALRDRLQAREEEQEIVADLLPGRGEDDQDHGVVAVEQRIPVDAERRAGRAPRCRARAGT